MQQNTNWMKLLIIGILSSIVFSRCKGHEEMFDHYSYTNTSGYDITIKTMYVDDDGGVKFLDTFFLANRQILTMKFSPIGGSGTEILGRDSVDIKFEDKRIASFKRRNCPEKYNILCVEPYSFSKNSDDTPLYSYTFTQEDFNNAKEL